MTGILPNKEELKQEINQVRTNKTRKEMPRKLPVKKQEEKEVKCKKSRQVRK